jgi:hypothetical protein
LAQGQPICFLELAKGTRKIRHYNELQFSLCLQLGWNVWLKAVTCRHLTTTLADLIEGSEYKFRVKAENPYGVSDPSIESEAVFIPDPKRG